MICSLGFLDALKRSLERWFALISSAQKDCWEECWLHLYAPWYLIRRVTFRRWTVGPFGRQISLAQRVPSQ